MPPVRLFHASYKPLRIGQTISPQFGQLADAPAIYEIVLSAFKEGRETLKALLLADALNRSSGDPRLPMFLKETIFELVRAAEFSSRPSRFNSVFLFHTLEDAVKFQRSQDRLHVVICEATRATLTGLDMALSGPMTDPVDPIDEQVTDLTDRASRYWRGEMTDAPRIEILASGGTVTVADTVR